MRKLLLRTTGKKSLALICFTLTLLILPHQSLAKEQETGILQDVPGRLFEAGYIDNSPAPITKRTKALLSQIAVPAGVTYVTSYGMAYALTRWAGANIHSTVFPITNLAWNLFLHNESLADFLLASWPNLLGLPLSLLYPEAFAPVGIGILFYGIALNFLPEWRIWQSTNTRIFQLDKVPSGLTLTLSHKQSSNPTLTLRWPSNMVSDEDSQIDRHPNNAALKKLAITGQRQGYAGISLFPTKKIKTSPLSISYSWVPADNSLSPVRTINLAETEHMDWWTDTLLMGSGIEIKQSSEATYADPLSPELLTQVANQTEGLVYAQTSNSWVANYQQNGSIGLLSAPGHFNIWLYPGETNLFSLYTSAIPEFILEGGNHWKHNLNQLNSNTTSPAFNGWARLPFNLLRFGTVNMLSIMGASNGTAAGNRCIKATNELLQEKHTRQHDENKRRALKKLEVDVQSQLAEIAAEPLRIYVGEYNRSLINHGNLDNHRLKELPTLAELNVLRNKLTVEIPPKNPDASPGDTVNPIWLYLDQMESTLRMAAQHNQEVSDFVRAVEPIR